MGELEAALSDEDPVVAEAAAWALGRGGATQEARPLAGQFVARPSTVVRTGDVPFNGGSCEIYPAPPRLSSYDIVIHFGRFV